MRIAEIHNDNKVHAIIDTEKHKSYDPNVLLGLKARGLRYSEVGAEVAEGWAFEDGSFVPPAETEDEAV